jgi:hypothetical protein
MKSEKKHEPDDKPLPWLYKLILLALALLAIMVLIELTRYLA